MATAEFAVAIPAVVLMLVVGLCALSTVSDQIRCTDAARATARLLARGDPVDTALGQGRRLAPAQARFSVRQGSATIEVQVTSPAPRPLRWLGVGAVPRGRAVAAVEDRGLGDGPP